MRKRVAFLCMVMLAFAALAVCPGAVGGDLGSPVAVSCPEAAEARYFPVNTLRTHWRNDDGSLRRWFSEHLAAMEEPSLSCGALKDTETYRFLWLRTFHNPIAVRLFWRGDDHGLEAVILDGAGGYSPGRVSRRVTKKLSRDQWQTVIATLGELQLWQMATDVILRGKDGAELIVEGRRDGRYHVVHRWSGTDDGLERVRKLFLELAGLGHVGPVH